MSAGDQRFPKSARLTKRPQYLAMNRDSRRWVSPHFIFLWKRNLLPQSRLGITITKRVAPAVGRNRVKRLVREAFRLAESSGVTCPKGVDLVVIAKKGAPRLRYAQTAREMHQALKHIQKQLDTGA
jgi:ribonuclease P protein component